MTDTGLHKQIATLRNRIAQVQRATLEEQEQAAPRLAHEVAEVVEAYTAQAPTDADSVNAMHALQEQLARFSRDVEARLEDARGALTMARKHREARKAYDGGQE